jgi:hypothetical protein
MAISKAKASQGALFPVMLDDLVPADHMCRDGGCVRQAARHGDAWIPTADPLIRLVNLCGVGGGVGWMCTLGTGNGKEGGHREEREGMHINEAGFIDIMTVALRPLPAVVEVQKPLAPKFGMKPLT